MIPDGIDFLKPIIVSKTMFTEQENELFASISKEKLESFPRLLANNYKESLIPSLLNQITISYLSTDERYEALKTLMKHKRIEGLELCYLTRCPTLLERFLKEEYCDPYEILDCMCHSISNWRTDSLNLLFKYHDDFDDFEVIRLIQCAINNYAWECLRFVLKKFDLDLGKHTIVLSSYVTLDVLKLLMRHGLNPRFHVQELTNVQNSVPLIKFLLDEDIEVDMDKIIGNACHQRNHDLIVFAFKNGAFPTKKDIADIGTANKETLVFLAKNGIEREMFTPEQLEIMDGTKESESIPSE